MTVAESGASRRTYELLSWFGAIGVGTSLFVGGRYFECWLRDNDPAEYPLVELFVEYPVEMLTRRPALMARNPVLSIVLSAVALASLCLRTWLLAAAALCWRSVADAAD